MAPVSTRLSLPAIPIAPLQGAMGIAERWRAENKDRPCLAYPERFAITDMKTNDRCSFGGA